MYSLEDFNALGDYVEEQRRRALEETINRENWDKVRRYNVGERVGKPIVNETIQNTLSAYRNVDEDDAERISPNNKYQVDNDFVSRGLGYLTDTLTTQAMINKAITPTMLSGLGAIGGNVVDGKVSGLGSLGDAAATVLSSFPNATKTATDIVLTDRMKAGREHNQGREYNHHVWDGATGATGALSDYVHMPKVSKEVMYDIMKMIGRGLAKTTKGISKKGVKFNIADTEGLTDEEVAEFLKDATESRYMD